MKSIYWSLVVPHAQNRAVEALQQKQEVRLPPSGTDCVATGTHTYKATCCCIQVVEDNLHPKSKETEWCILLREACAQRLWKAAQRSEETGQAGREEGIGLQRSSQERGVWVCAGLEGTSCSSVRGRDKALDRRIRAHQKGYWWCNVKCELRFVSHATGSLCRLSEEGLMTILAICFGPNMDITVDIFISSVKIHYVATCVRGGSLFLACSALSRAGSVWSTIGANLNSSE